MLPVCVVRMRSLLVNIVFPRHELRHSQSQWPWMQALARYTAPVAYGGRRKAGTAAQHIADWPSSRRVQVQRTGRTFGDALAEFVCVDLEIPVGDEQIAISPQPGGHRLKNPPPADAAVHPRDSAVLAGARC